MPRRTKFHNHLVSKPPSFSVTEKEKKVMKVFDDLLASIKIRRGERREALWEQVRNVVTRLAIEKRRKEEANKALEEAEEGYDKERRRRQALEVQLQEARKELNDLKRERALKNNLR